MRVINRLVFLLLVVATALLAQFYLGSQGQHDEAMAQHLWSELMLRFIFCSSAGLLGAGLWLGLNYGLLKSGFVQNINLRKMALLVVAGVLSGLLAGALFFCLS